MITFNLDDYFDQLNDKKLYNYLLSVRMDVFPNDYKIVIKHNSDFYESDKNLGEKIKQLQNVITSLDIPHFFVWVHSTNPRIKEELQLAKEIYNANEDIPINSKVVDGSFEKINITSDSFCVFPWIHYFVNPQGLVGPCCEFNENFPVGDLKEENLEDVIYGTGFAELRQSMLNGKKPSACDTCWKKESYNLTSTRQKINAKYSSEFINELKSSTDPTGVYNNFKLKKLDFRPSNVCNLMCRMCGGKFSSKIAKEEQKIYGNSFYIDNKLTDDSIKQIFDNIEKNIFEIENIYFAGGEPLIMESTYKILDMFLHYGRKDVKIKYNTNFSLLKYKSYHAIDYWQKFDNVEIGASIDAIGPISQYVRHGVDYNILEKNYYEVQKYCPHVVFCLDSVVHALNVNSLQELQKRWIDKIGLSPNNINFSILVYPEHMQLSVLPEDVKKTYSENITNHINWLKNIDQTNHLIDLWQQCLDLLKLDHTHLQKEFINLNITKDKYRNQNILELYPELQTIVGKYAKD